MNKFAENLKIVIGVIGLIWVIHFINPIFPMEFRAYGIRPRLMSGLWGIPLAPFLHGDIGHLMANTGALACLLMISLSLSRQLTVMAVVLITLLGGFLVWGCGTYGTNHIGASGVIFGLLGFLLFAGIFRKDFKSLILSIIVFFLYGGILLSLLVPKTGISWAGHFWGFVAGVFAAWTTKMKRKKMEEG